MSAIFLPDSDHHAPRRNGHRSLSDEQADERLGAATASLATPTPISRPHRSCWRSPSVGAGSLASGGVPGVSRSGGTARGRGRPRHSRRFSAPPEGEAVAVVVDRRKLRSDRRAPQRRADPDSARCRKVVAGHCARRDQRRRVAPRSPFARAHGSEPRERADEPADTGRAATE